MRAHHVVGLTLLVMLTGCVVESPPAPLLPLPVASTPASTSYATQAPAAARTRTPGNQRVTTATPAIVYPGYPAYAVYPAYPFYGPYPFYPGYYPYPFFPGYLGFGYRFP